MIITNAELAKSLNGLEVNGLGYAEVLTSIKAKDSALSDASAKKQAIMKVLEPALDFGTHKNDNAAKKTVLDVISTLWQDHRAIKNLKDAQNFLTDWLVGYDVLKSF